MPQGSPGDTVEASKLRTLLLELEEEERMTKNNDTSSLRKNSSSQHDYQEAKESKLSSTVESDGECIPNKKSLPILLENLHLKDDEEKKNVRVSDTKITHHAQESDKENNPPCLTAKGVGKKDQPYSHKDYYTPAQTVTEKQLPQLQIGDPEFKDVKTITGTTYNPILDTVDATYSNVTGRIVGQHNAEVNYVELSDEPWKQPRSLNTYDRPPYFGGVSNIPGGQVPRSCASLDLSKDIGYSVTSHPAPDFTNPLEFVICSEPAVVPSQQWTYRTHKPELDIDSLPSCIGSTLSSQSQGFLPQAYHTIDMYPSLHMRDPRMNGVHEANIVEPKYLSTTYPPHVPYQNSDGVYSLPLGHSQSMIHISEKSSTQDAQDRFPDHKELTVGNSNGISCKTSDKDDSNSRTGVKRPSTDDHQVHVDQKYMDDDGNKPLHLAIDVLQDVTQSYDSRKRARHVIDNLESFTDLVNLTNNNHQTPLFLAVMYNLKDIVVRLIDCGADVNEQGREESTKQWMTPLHIAATNGTEGWDVMRVLLEQKEININMESLTCRCVPLHRAIESKCHEGIKLLIEKKCNVFAEDDKGYTPLMLAIQTKDLNIIRQVLESVPCQERRDYVNIFNTCGNTCLHIAAGLPKIDDHVKVQILRYLIQNHADVHLMNRDNETAQNIAPMQMKEVLRAYEKKSTTNPAAWRG